MPGRVFTEQERKRLDAFPAENRGIRPDSILHFVRFRSGVRKVATRRLQPPGFYLPDLRTALPGVRP
jgi:hypothetical protein